MELEVNELWFAGVPGAKPVRPHTHLQRMALRSWALVIHQLLKLEADPPEERRRKPREPGLEPARQVRRAIPMEA